MNAKSEEGGIDGGCSIWSCILSKDEDDDDDDDITYINKCRY